MNRHAPAELLTSPHVVETGDSVGARVRRLRKLRGWTQERLADASGISRPQITKIESDDVPQVRATTIDAIARALNTSVDALVVGTAFFPAGITQPGQTVIRDASRDDIPASSVSLSAFTDQFDVIDFNKGMVEVPIEAEVACGEPMDFSVRGEGVLLPATFAPDPEKHEQLVRARGDSMLEFGIRDGDYVVVEMRDGGVAATGELILAWLEPADRAVGGGVTLKRWVRRGGRKILQSGNPEFPSYELKDGDVFRLIGIVRRSLTMRYHPKISG